MKNVLVFDVPVNDSVSSNNIIYTIRTANSYPFRNIWLFVSTTSPSGKVLTDTVQYNLADEKGNRYGRGFGNILELDLPYRSSVWFPEKGTYTFKVVHGMRPGLLEGVTDFGLRIEKTK
jgi:gliding motility-associated lipoprotein GldH